MTHTATTRRTPSDEEQRTRIATETDSTLFVEAGAGSGKTRSLVDRTCTLVLDGGIPIGSIAVVTFTKKAAAELRDRLRARFQQARRRADRVLSPASDGLAAGTGQPDETPSLTHDDATQLRERATRALEELDSATIGTLHSFAQTILTLHSVEAGVPPLIDVMDDLAASAAHEQQWREIRTSLLTDPALSDTMLIALDAGIQLTDFRAIAEALTRDWDLIERRIPLDAPATVPAPDLTPLLRSAEELLRARDDCTDPSDLFLGRLSDLQEWVTDAQRADGTGQKLAALRAAGTLKWSNGRAGNWPAGRLTDVRQACKDWQADVAAAAATLTDAVVTSLVSAVARGVLLHAEARAASGRLTYQDLLVLALRLVTGRRPHAAAMSPGASAAPSTESNATDQPTTDPMALAAEVRASLQRRFPVLLLDEFQDTDPIQLELAVRIAGGAPAHAPSWEDVALPDGSLFVVGDPKQSIYRFRRANIATYLRAQQHLGETVRLTTNFRTVAPILEWVNAVCGELLQPEPEAQPAYQALQPYRVGAGDGPAVTVLGARPHPSGTNAPELRAIEAADVAATVRQALAEAWTTYDDVTHAWRPLRPADIAVLVPTAASVPVLIEALTSVGIAHRSAVDTHSYRAEPVRHLFAAVRAVADPTDELSAVTALRSPLFGCGDDDLLRWKLAGGSFDVSRPLPADAPDSAARAAVEYLRGLHFRARGLTPSTLLTTIIDDRRMLEFAATTPHRRETWRELRYVVDQARAWSEANHGSLRDYVRWAAAQSDPALRSHEPTVPEMDVDAVTISTVHAAKGLEYGMVVLSGMTSVLPTSTPPLLWPADGGFAAQLRSGLSTSNYGEAAGTDKHLSELEIRRLLYVATTRARDHLVVSLHHTDRPADSPARTRAELMLRAGAAQAPGTVIREFDAEVTTAPLPSPVVSPPPELAAWRRQLREAQANAERPAAVSASSLEGGTTDAAGLGAAAESSAAPVLTTAAAGGSAAARAEPAAAYLSEAATAAELGHESGTHVGLAVHQVLESMDFSALGSATDTSPDSDLIAAACADHAAPPATVRALVQSALDSETLAHAAGRQHWRETWVGTTQPDGTVVEGIVDLLYRDDDGTLVIVDYKTDEVPTAALNERAAFYQPQIDAYISAVRAATGAPVRGVLLFLRTDGPAIEVAGVA